MTMNCPLPIDWLDLLEGRPTIAARTHLGTCSSCQAVVAALRDLPSLGLAVPQNLDENAGHTRIRLNDTDDPRVVEWQLRWLAVDDADVRLPVVVLGFADEDSHAAFIEPGAGSVTSAEIPGQRLVDIVPLWTDQENATSADLLLDEADTTTGIAWRVVFRRQTVAPAHLLAVMFGHLTASGEAVISQALAGRFPPERTGADLESEFDPRLTADSWMDEVLYHALSQVAEPGDAPVSEGLAEHAPSGHDPDIMWTDESGRTYVLELKRVTESDISGNVLAAAPTRYRRSVLWAHLRSVAGQQLDARIRWDRHNDRLVLHPQVVKGFSTMVVIIVRSSQLNDPLRVNARLRPDSEVVLSEGAGISDRDIDALELQLS